MTKKEYTNACVELVDLLKKKLLIKESSSEDALEVWVNCNGMQLITLERSTTVPNVTNEINKFKELFLKVCKK